MLNITHFQQVPLPFFNELEEVRVHSHMGPSMCSLASPEKEKSVVFMFRESEKNLKTIPMLSFFVMLVS